MTHEDWLTSTDPQQLLRFLRDRGASDGPLRGRGCYANLVLEKD